MNENPYQSPLIESAEKSGAQNDSREASPVKSLFVTVGIWLFFGFVTLSFTYQILPFIFVLGSGIAGALPAIKNCHQKWMILGPILTGATIIPILVLIHTLYETMVYNDWENFPSIIWAPGIIFTGALVGGVFGFSYLVVHICNGIAFGRKKIAK